MSPGNQRIAGACVRAGRPGGSGDTDGAVGASSDAAGPVAAPPAGPAPPADTSAARRGP